jgi:hypothetical protein
VSVDLLSETGAELNVGGSGWDFVLNVAQEYGWAPLGTEPPADCPPADWSGGYDTSDGQRVVARDAAALAAALRRAAADPHRKEVEAQVSREQSAAVRTILLRDHGITLPEEEDVGRTIDEEFLEVLASFCAGGSFTVS